MCLHLLAINTLKVKRIRYQSKNSHSVKTCRPHIEGRGEKKTRKDKTAAINSETSQHTKTLPDLGRHSPTE